jgi:hypothetical protein
VTEKIDVLCIGNAIVDVIADADDAFLNQGSQGIDAADRRRGGVRLYEAMGPAARSAAARPATPPRALARWAGKRRLHRPGRDDQLGRSTATTSSLGVEFHARRAPTSAPTARSLILVTPDAQRTMNTFLGAAQQLEPASAVDLAQSPRAGSSISKAICGIRPEPRAAMERRSRRPAPPGARSPSRCPTASASTATATASGSCSERQDRHPVRQ